MAIYVYITKQCQKDISEQRYEDTVNSFKAKIEKTQQTDVFDRFPPPFLKKRFERQIRLVAKECLVGEDIVVAFLRLFVRGGREYAEFGNADYRTLPGFDAMENEVSEESLKVYLASIAEPPPSPPPAPNDNEYQYLHTVLSEMKDFYQDHHCCETQLWIERINSDEFASRLNLFHDPIFDTIDCKEEGLKEIRCPKDKRFGFLCYTAPDQRMVILLTPFRDNAPIDEVRSLYPELIANSPITREIALKKAKRAYPHELLLNEDAWFQVEKDRDGNMALSPEEIEVLQSARGFDGGYPLFINGRAGSGKSTILQYLFAEYIYHAINDENFSLIPRFFACNEQLLQRCSESVRALIDGRRAKCDKKAIPDKDWRGRSQEMFSAAFRNFHTTLHDLVSPADFPTDKLIDYGRFKQWWERRFARQSSARKLYDPDISWHVIRSYIKGINPEGILEPEDYSEIPAKQKSVSPETYRIVFEEVWRRYKKDQDELGLWDHQDLAREVLSNNLVKSIHPVVFCDEAQDFTLIELEVLYRYGLFGGRTLKSSDLGRIPFAFAGDPFQTLNPTGFRWEATKALFVDKFIKASSGARRRALNYKELSYNYRSSRSIVKFCNSIQLVRSAVFDYSEIRPQHPWEDGGDPASVVYFERGDIQVLEALRAQSEIRVIVPCEEGAEAEWARQNGLADFVEFDEADVPKNVVSPTRVKGLEFDRVVLFGFGGACPGILRRAINESLEPLTGDKAIEPQYFLNRLYVAASRPRKRLFIIDGRDDIDGFWNPIFTNEENYALRTDKVQDWEGNCGRAIPGSIDSWDGDREDPIETAEKLAKEGRLRNDRVLLRQAAQSYKGAGKEALGDRCLAEAFVLEEDFLKAAERWRKIEDFDQSLSCAWRAGRAGDSFIRTLGEQRPELKNRIHHKFALFFVTPSGLGEGVSLLKDLADSFSHESLKEEILTVPIWKDRISECSEHMLRSQEQGRGLWETAYIRLKSISEMGVRLSPLSLGEFAYRANILSAAYQHWRTMPSSDLSKIDARYLRAKASCEGFPDNLNVYGELLLKHRDRNDAEEILALATKEGEKSLLPSHREVIALAKFLLNDVPIQEIPFVKDIELLSKIAESEAVRGDSQTIKLIIRRMIQLLADGGKWQDIVEWAKNKERMNNAIADFRRKASVEFDGIVASFIACDARFEDARNEVKTAFADWVRCAFDVSFSWKTSIHPIIIGRALERAGLFRETLPYYEAVAHSSLFSKGVRDLAWERWARTKWLQGQREMEVGTRQRAEKVLAEAQEKAVTVGFRSAELIPEELIDPLPVVDLLSLRGGISEPESLTPSVKLKDSKTMEETLPSKLQPETRFGRSTSFGVLSVRVSGDGLRVKIEDPNSLQGVDIDLRKGNVYCDGTRLTPTEKGAFAISPLNIDLAVSEVSAGRLKVSTPDGFEIIIPTAAVQVFFDE